MTILYLDCQAGISGDMTVAALLDLGVPLAHLESELARLNLPAGSYRLATSSAERRHMTALKFDVTVDDHHTHRHYADIDAMIAGSPLSEAVRVMARTIFRRLADAEAKVHGVPVEDVHFHEVGAVDSIVDIVAVAICLEYLAVEKVYCAPLPLGSGFVETAHGLLPVPAPATAELLTGLQVHFRCGPGERVTPTGAAIVAALAKPSRDLPAMTVEQVGCGAGTKDFEDMPNVLRAVLGRENAHCDESIVEASCNLDDVTPEVIGYIQELLLEHGALDVWLMPMQMKKGRPGMMLSFLCRPEQREMLFKAVAAESGTLGIRYRLLERCTLPRRIETRATSFGEVRFKVGPHGGKPEYDDCRRIARERGIPCRDVMRRLSMEETQ